MESYSEKVDALRDKATSEFKTGNIEDAILNLQKAWTELPEPKYEKPESFLISKSLVFVFNKIKEYEKSLDWAKKLMKSDLSRHDSGDREFMAGTVLYHLGRKDDARQYFDVANNKSEGRCFLGADKKEYKDFFKSKK